MLTTAYELQLWSKVIGVQTIHADGKDVFLPASGNWVCKGVVQSHPALDMTGVFKIELLDG